MSDGLRDLLLYMRQHPSFPELLKAVEPPQIRSFKVSEDTHKQTSDWIYRSGRSSQDVLWRQFLTEGIPPQQEKS